MKQEPSLGHYLKQLSALVTPAVPINSLLSPIDIDAISHSPDPQGLIQTAANVIAVDDSSDESPPRPARIPTFPGPEDRQICTDLPTFPEDVEIFRAGAEWQRSFPWSRAIADINQRVFRNTAFRPVQEAAINAVMEGRDVFVCMPTGGGKSLIYQLPAVCNDGVTIVVMPLIALIRDQAEKAKALGLKHCAFATGMKLHEKEASYESFRNSRDLSLVFLTPERLEKCTRTQEILLTLHMQNRLSRFIVDEAHCVSKWGRRFRPDYLQLEQFRKQFPTVPIVAMTATASDFVKRDVCAILGMKSTVEFRCSGNRPNLRYSVKPKTWGVLRDIATYIMTTHMNHTGLIYCLSRDETERVAAHLQGIYKLSIECYHAGMEIEKRLKAEKKWKSGKVKILASTIAFGMGIDKPDVRFVIHHSMPMSVDNYCQESGRAGRDGLPSDCILYYSPSDIDRNRSLICYDTKPDDTTFGAQIDLLEIMGNYCEERVECRRCLLLGFFGEEFNKERCARMCDNCYSPPHVVSRDLTSAAKALLSLISTTRVWNPSDLVWHLSRSPDLSEAQSGAWVALQQLKKVELLALYRRLISDCVIQHRGKKADAVLSPGPGEPDFLKSEKPLILNFDQEMLEGSKALRGRPSAYRGVQKPFPALSEQLQVELEMELLDLVETLKSSGGNQGLSREEVVAMRGKWPRNKREAENLGCGDIDNRFIKAVRSFLEKNRPKKRRKVQNTGEEAIVNIEP